MSDTTTRSDDVTRYWCFISYSHGDNRDEGRQWATWLHHELETYEIPVDLVGSRNRDGFTLPPRIYPVFRDEEELAAGAGLTDRIYESLDSSRTLVVLCSPRAVASTYVGDEIAHFKRRVASKQVYAAVIDGNPTATTVEARKCFPDPLCFELDDDGNIGSTPAEPLAADFRLADGAQGWTSPEGLRRALRDSGASDVARQVDAYTARLHLAKLKLIAGILGVALGELTKRDKAYQLKQAIERARRQRRLAIVFASLAIVAIGAGVYANVQRKEAALQRDEANRQRDDADTQRSVAEDARGKADAQRQVAERESHLNLSQRLAAESTQLLGADLKRAGLWAAEAILATDAKTEGVTAEATSAANAVTSLLGGRAFASPHQDAPVKADFSSDDRMIATVDYDGGVRVFELGSSLPGLRHVLNAGASLNFLAFDAGGRQLITHSGHTGIARVSRLEPGQVYLDAVNLRDPYGEEQFGSLALTPDRKLLAASTLDAVVIFDLDDSRGPAVVRSFERTEQGKSTALRFSEDGTLLLSGSAEGWVEIWDVRSAGAAPVSVFQSYHSANQLGRERTVPIEILEISRDRKSLVTASQDWIGSSSQADLSAKLWKLKDLRPTGRPRLLPHEQAISSIHFIGSGDDVITTSLDGEVRRWSRAVDGPAATLLKPTCDCMPGDPFKNINSAALFPDERLLAVANADEVLRIVDLSAKGVEPTVLHGSVSEFVSLSLNGRWLAAGDGPGAVRVWDMHGSSPTRLLMGNPPVDSEIAEDARVGATFAKGAVSIWDLATPSTPKPLFSFESVIGADDCPRCLLHLSSDGQWMVYQSDADKDRSFLRRTTPDTDVVSLATRTWTYEPMFSPDAGWLLVDDLIYDLSGSDQPPPVRLLPPGSQAHGAQFSRHDRWLFMRKWGSAGPSSGTAGYLWNLGSRRSFDFFEILGPEATESAFSPDELWLAFAADSLGDYIDKDSATEMTEVHLIPLGNKAPGEVIRLPGHELKPGMLEFSPDSRWLLSATDNTLAGERLTQTRLWALGVDGFETQPIILPGVDTYLRLAEFSENSAILITLAGTQDFARVWRLDAASGDVVETGQLRGPLPDLNNHWRLTITPNAEYVVLIADDSPTPYLWGLSADGVPSRGAALALDASSDRSIGAVKFSTDGRTLFVSSASSAHYGGVARRGGQLNAFLLPAPSAYSDAPAAVELLDVADESIGAFALREDAHAVILPGRTLHVADFFDRERVLNQLADRIGRNMTWEEWVLAHLEGGYHKTFTALPVHYSVVRELAKRLLRGGSRALEEVSLGELVKWTLEVDSPSLCNQVAWALVASGEGRLGLMAIDCALRHQPDEANYRDTRGVARALEGDHKGAVKDFKYFISRQPSVEDAVKRREWIAALSRGENPFPAALK